MVKYNELKPYLSYEEPPTNPHIISVHTRKKTHLGQVHKFIVINGEIVLLTIMDYESKKQVTIPGEHITSIKACANMPE
jgi:hypothetical protein